MSRVLYLPGVLGSTLGWRVGDAEPWHPCWPDPVELLHGGLVALQLGADALSPGPLAQGRVCTTEGVYVPVYGPLGGFLLGLGYDVLAAGYDWRLSITDSAAAVWRLVQPWAQGEPFRCVAHSMGGLVASALYHLMSEAGHASQFSRLISLGVPWYGSMQPVRLWWHLPLFYRLLVLYTGWGRWIPGTPGPQYLDAVLATHPSWYQLMASGSAGPLYDQYPEQAALLYTSSYYALGANRYISGGLLETALALQTILPSWFPPQITVIAGVGQQTAYALVTDHPAYTRSGYLYTDAGDGVVTLAQATPPGVTPIEVPQQHNLLPLDPAVWAHVWAALQ